MSTAVELYLDSKKIDYRLDGNNAIAICPICEQGDKWGINIDSGLWNCFRGSCGAKGNLKTLRRHYGDPVEEVVSNLEEDVPVTRVAVKNNKPEPPPDYELYHERLLTNDTILNYLNDDRGFSLETIKHFKIGLHARKFENGLPVPALVFPYFSKGKCYGGKFKSLPPEPKDFRFTKLVDIGLYNVDVIKQGMEYLILCEGETDLMMLHQQGYENAVGIPGANSKKADWAPLLDLPKKLYLVLDNDDVGVEAAIAFANRFGINRVNIVNIPKLELYTPVEDKHGTRTTVSDVNEFFYNGGTKEDFDILLAEAHPLDIEGVTTMDTAFDNLIAQLEETGSISYPYEFKWASVTARAKGIKSGDLVVVLAAAKCGKTTWVLNQTDFMVQRYGCRVHFECMEMDAEELTKKWTAMTLEKDEDSITKADILKGQKINRDRGNSFIFTRSYPTSIEDFVEGLDKTQMRYDTNVKVIDNFQALIDLTIGRGKDNNRPNYMSRVSKILKASAKKWGPTFLISQPKGLQEGQMVTVNDSEGSTCLTKDADLFFAMNRNPEVRMKIGEMAQMSNFETSQSHSETIYIDLGLSRRSAGGICTLKIDGAKSTIRDFNSDESVAGIRKNMINGILIIDDSEQVKVEI